jgi:hypothetical protein
MSLSQSEPEDCIICFELLKPNNSCQKFMCSHIFHTKCIELWLNTSPNKNCPYCKSDIKPISYQPIIYKLNSKLETIFNDTFTNQFIMLDNKFDVDMIKDYMIQHKKNSSFILIYIINDDINKKEFAFTINNREVKSTDNIMFLVKKNNGNHLEMKWDERWNYKQKFDNMNYHFHRIQVINGAFDSSSLSV